MAVFLPSPPVGREWTRISPAGSVASPAVSSQVIDILTHCNQDLLRIAEPRLSGGKGGVCRRENTIPDPSRARSLSLTLSPTLLSISNTLPHDRLNGLNVYISHTFSLFPEEITENPDSKVRPGGSTSFLQKSILIYAPSEVLISDTDAGDLIPVRNNHGGGGECSFPPRIFPFFCLFQMFRKSAYFRFSPRIFEPLLVNCCSIWSKKVSDFLLIEKKLFRNCVFQNIKLTPHFPQKIPMT